MRRLLVAALLVAGCAKSLGARDVELTVSVPVAPFSDADLATVTALELTLSGGQSGHTRYDLTRTMLRQEKLVIHLTASSGEVTIAALARDGQSLVVGAGSTQMTLSGSDAHPIEVDLAPPPGGLHSASAIGITPTQAQLFTGQTVPLTASSPVQWSVTSGGAGGSVDASGVYTAAANTGSDAIVAESSVFYGEQASATVDVFKTGILRYAGLGRGPGTVDGVGPQARICFPRGLAFDGAGNAYFSDAGNVVRKLDVTSGTVTTIAGTIENPAFADGTGAAAGFENPWGIAWDGTRGVLYVADNNTLRKLVVATGVVTTLAGSSNMWGSADGTGSAATFQWLWGLAYDGNGQLYAADAVAGNVRQIDVVSGAVTTVAGVPSSAGYVDGAGATAKFNFPDALALDGKGGLFVGDAHNQLIRKIDLGTKMVSTVTGVLGVASGIDGAPGKATVSYPQALVYDGSGTLWSVEGVLRKIDAATGDVTSPMFDKMNVAGPFYTGVALGPDGKLYVGGTGSVGSIDLSSFAATSIAGVALSYNDYNPVNGSRWVARFNTLESVTTAPDGSLYLRDGPSVRHVDLGGDSVSDVYQGPWIGGQGNIAFGSDGTLYIAGDGDNTIHTLLASEQYSTVHTFAGDAAGGYMDGSLTQARFASPNDLALVGNVLYVTDTGNNVIRAIDLSAGMVSTLAGTANMGGLVDMPGAAARFNGPQGIVADGNGNLYVTSNNAVRKIVISGAVVSTVAGGDTTGYADGSGSAAKFAFPFRIALDPAKQNLYVSDVKNTAIRKVTLAGVVTTVAGARGQALVTTGALPGTINEPAALSFAPNGDLLVVVPHEETLLQIRLP